MENLERFKNPSEELRSVKRNTEFISQEKFNKPFERLSDAEQVVAVSRNIEQHRDSRLENSHPGSVASAEKVVLKLSPDEDDDYIKSLLGIVQEQGLLNTLKAIESTESFHIKDDLHRALVQFIKAGFDVGVKESNPIYKGLHMTLFEIYLPVKTDERDQERDLKTLLSSMEQFYAGMMSVASGSVGGSDYFTLEVAMPQGRKEVVFYCCVPNQKVSIFRNQILSIFPEASLIESTDDYNIFNKREFTSVSQVSLEESDALPIKTYENFDYDPINIFLKSFSNLELEEGASFQIVLSPNDQSYSGKLNSAIKDLQKGEEIKKALNLNKSGVVEGARKFVEFFDSDNGPKEIKDVEYRNSIVEEIRKKNSSRTFKSNIRIISAGLSEMGSNMILDEIESAFFQFENTSGNRFKFERLKKAKLKKAISDFTFRTFDKSNATNLNLAELTSIFHFPKGGRDGLGGVLSAQQGTTRGVSSSIKSASSGEFSGEQKNILGNFNQNRNLGSIDNSGIESQSVRMPSQQAQFENQQTDTSLDYSAEQNSSNGTFAQSQGMGAPDFTSTPRTQPPVQPQTPAASYSDPAPVENKIMLGVNIHQGLETPIYMSPKDRLRHFYAIGQTGTGKSNILTSMIMQDIDNGDGCCFIDPHGNDVEYILENIPEHRMDDVIYFDPADLSNPMAMNMLEYDERYPEQKTFVINEMLSIFKKLYGASPESMGPAFEQYFRNATALVMEHPESGNTLFEISKVLSDEVFRSYKLSKMKPGVVKQFWEKIATQAGGDASLENIVPYITNKFDVFMANDFMRPIIGQEKSSLRFREIMDSKKILLVNLSKGRVGELNSNMIGMIIVGKILMAALSRADSVDTDFAPFYLYIDEFQNISTDSISQILSEARKYKLSLNVAHQFIAQLDEGIKNAVFGNVGSMAIFRTSPEDAEFLEKQLQPIFKAEDIQNISNYNCYVKMLLDGHPQEPFSLAAIPPRDGSKEVRETIKRMSAQKYGRPRDDVESEITRKFFT